MCTTAAERWLPVVRLCNPPQLTSLLCGVDNALMAKIMEDIANKDISRLKSEFKHLKSVGGKVTLSDFKLLTVLGRGGYGKVSHFHVSLHKLDNMKLQYHCSFLTKLFKDSTIKS